MPRWPLSRRATVAAVVAAFGATTLLVLFVGGAPLIICWTGVGPAPEPATSECVTAKIAALTPVQRLWLDAPLAASALFVIAGFVAVMAVIVLIALVLTRRTAR